MPATQILLVAGTAILVAMSIYVAASLKARNNVAMAFVQSALSVFAVISLLSYQPLTNAANQIIPKSLYTLLIAAALFINILISTQRYASPIIYSLYLTGKVITVYAYLVKPHWGIAMIATWLAMTLLLVSAAWRAHRRSVVIISTASVALSICLLPIQSSLDERSRYARLFGSLTLLAMQSPESYFTNYFSGTNLWVHR